MQNDEGSGKATQSHINATSKPPQSVLIGNRLRPQSHPKATQGYPKARNVLAGQGPNAFASGSRITNLAGHEFVC
jgi:hypothetical protein